jgi:DNA-binding NarL/FixJ family response regulator
MVNSNSNQQPIYAPSRGTAPLVDKTIRLLIADSHAFYRKELRQTCEAEKDLRIVAEAETGLEAVDLARDLKPDVVLMDIQMPLIDGIQATRHILVANPQIAVILLTVYRDNEKLLAAVRAGASAHLPKDALASELLDTIRAVYHGETHVDSQVIARILDTLRREGAGRNL